MVTPAGQEAAVDKVIKMTDLRDISIPMQTATSMLADHLVQSEPFLRYKAAGDRLNADPTALQLLADLSALQQKIRQQQKSGAVPKSDIDLLRALRDAIEANEIIQDQLLTQKLAIAFLREVNQEISQLLGVDFASLARRSSGCC
jgi:cell fate (sporulation/competence/biofilm development) regulator YlbF (YheA/YmcA/DUF963 family)